MEKDLEINAPHGMTRVRSNPTVEVSKKYERVKNWDGWRN